MENNIKISKVCGLCAGCKYAIDSALKSTLSNKQTILFKEIVHNRNVNEMLKSKGIYTIDSITEFPSDATIIIRAHGEPKSTFDFLKSKNINYIDCTCVNVKKIHELVDDFSKNNHLIIIIGKYGKHSGKPHPEIEGTIGWCNSKPILIEDDEDLFKLEKYQNQKFYLICQTTFNMQKADALINKIESITKQHNCTITINKSICNAQKQINIFSSKLAEECDLMIVVGGKHSSNSIELFNNLKNITQTIFIEDIHSVKQEIQQQNITFSKNMKIGITAGASTMKEELVSLKEILENLIEEQ